MASGDRSIHIYCSRYTQQTMSHLYFLGKSTTMGTYLRFRIQETATKEKLLFSGKDGGAGMPATCKSRKMEGRNERKLVRRNGGRRRKRKHIIRQGPGSHHEEEASKDLLKRFTRMLQH